jgi:hypothetical protein
MQTGISIGCLLVLLLVGIPFAFKYPWRVLMLTGFCLVHVAAMVGYSALMARLTASPHPAARRLVNAHATLSALLADDHQLPEGVRHSKLARRTVQTIVYVSVFVFYGWLLLTLGDLLDWLEKP